VAAVKRACSGRIGSLIDLLRGKLDKGVMEVVTHRREGLFPLPGEIKFDCDCPDWAGMCKHIAAVLYGVGARLDHSPEMLFLLRGVNHEELIDVTAVITDATKGGTSRRRIAAEGVSGIFGIEMADAAPVEPVKTVKSKPVKKDPVVPVPEPAKKGRKTVTGKPAFPEPLTGEAIREWRKRLGDTQAGFAARIKVTAASVSNWERRGKEPVTVFDATDKALRKLWKASL